MSRKEAGFVAGAAAFTGFEGARPWNAELISAAPAKFTLNGSLLEAAAAAAGCEKAKASSRELAVLKEKGSAAAGAGAGRWRGRPRPPAPPAPSCLLSPAQAVQQCLELLQLRRFHPLSVVERRREPGDGTAVELFQKALSLAALIVLPGHHCCIGVYLTSFFAG